MYRVYFLRPPTSGREKIGKFLTSAGQFVGRHPVLSLQAGALGPAYAWGRSSESRRLERLADTPQEQYTPDLGRASRASKTKIALGVVTFPSGPIAHFLGKEHASKAALRSGKFQDVRVRVFPSTQEVRKQMKAEIPEVQEMAKILGESPTWTRKELRQIRDSYKKTATTHAKIIPATWKVPKTRRAAEDLPEMTGGFSSSSPQWLTFGPRPRGFKA